MTLNALIEEAKKLPLNEQVDLLDHLYCMINVQRDDAGLTPEQAADLDRRIEELESGKAKLIPGDEAMEMLRKRV